MAIMYYEQDCDLTLLKGKKVAIIGYGSQGHAHALNLKDSGVDVVVGLYEGSKSWAKAEEAGLQVMTAFDAAKVADIIMILINDEKQPKLYKESIEPNLTPREWHEMAVFEYGHTIGLKDGAKEFIEALRKQGVMIALATVSSRELYEPFLQNKGIHQYFDVCVDTSQVQRGKGYPDVYLFAVQELSRSLEHPLAPSDCIVFEDVLQAIQAARKGGFQTCGVYDPSSGEEWASIQRAADMTVRNFMQLL